jgi:hypothetical protein
MKAARTHNFGANINFMISFEGVRFVLLSPGLKTSLKADSLLVDDIVYS